MTVEFGRLARPPHARAGKALLFAVTDEWKFKDKDKDKVLHN
jgi:hypothetical protein